MSGATTTTLSALVKPEVHAMISDSVFRNSEFLPLFRQIGPIGGTGYQLKVIVAANGSAQVYTEDQLVPSAGYQQVVTATASWKHIRTIARITGHARREMNAGWDDMAWSGAYGGVNVEISGAIADMVDLTNTTFLANTTYGVVGIVDDDTTAFYDLSRATYTTLKSYVLGSVGALALADFDHLVHETYNAPYGGNIQLIVMPPAQARKYAGLIAGKIQIPSAGDISGGGPGNLPPYGGIPCIEVRDLSATVILGLSDLDTGWFYVVHEAAPGGISIDKYGMDSDAATWQISTAGALICTKPYHQGKLEGVGTT